MLLFSVIISKDGCCNNTGFIDIYQMFLFVVDRQQFHQLASLL